MSPRLQFWPAPIFPGNTIEYRAYIEANETTIYPTLVTGASAPVFCAGWDASGLAKCPSNGTSAILAAESLFITSGGEGLVERGCWTRAAHRAS